VKLFSAVAALAGIALIAGLIAHFGFAAVTRTLFAVGWQGFAAVCAIHLGLVAAMGIGWGVLMPGTPLWVPIWGRLVRDSGSELLPLSQVGGYVLGARAVTLAGIAGTLAAASTIVDVTLELFAQLAYTALGLSSLVYLKPDAAIAKPIAIGLCAALLLAAGFLLVQHRGPALVDRLARILGHGWADKTVAGAAAMHSALTSIYRLRRRIWSSFALHLACWIASTLEAWVALRFAGAALDLLTVLVIESLLYAVRSFAFAVPNAIGVQEAAYVLLGAQFGLAPETALALSLLKRARDLSFGLPALTAWQIFEGGRLWRRVADRLAHGSEPKQNPGRDDRGSSLVSRLR
jgi:putative membrane protein